MTALNAAAYRLRLTAVTPVYVGGGEEAVLNRCHYFCDHIRKTLHVIDQRKLAQLLARKNLMDQFAKRLSAAPTQVRMENLLGDFKISPREMGTITAYTLDISHLEKKGLNDLRAFIKNAEGLPYIPGSGIKGAMRTALLAADLLQHSQRYQNERQEILRHLDNLAAAAQGRQRPHAPPLSASSLEKKAFETMPDFKEGPLKSVMRGLKVGDTTPVSRESLMVAQKKDLLPSPAPGQSQVKGISVFREYLKPGTTCTFSLTLDPYFLGAAGVKDVKDLFSKLNAFTDWLLNSPDSPYVSYRKMGVDYQLELLQKESRPLICVGGGAGYLSKTVIYPLLGGFSAAVPKVARLLDLKFSKHKHAAKDKTAAPRALKLVEYRGRYYLPGWCALEVVK